jgi:hypothetical protein
LAGEAAQDRSRGRKLPRMAIALTGFALISSALVLKGGVPPLLKTPPVVPPANDIARAHNFSGQTADAPADISTMPPAGLSGTTPVAPVVDAQAVEGLASQASEQTCPSSDDLRHIAGFQKGGFGSSLIEIMRRAVDAASDGLRLSGA